MDLVDKYLGEGKDYDFPVIKAKMKQMKHLRNFEAFRSTVMDSPKWNKLKDKEQAKLIKMFADYKKHTFGG
jgi:hypothetical protein